MKEYDIKNLLYFFITLCICVFSNAVYSQTPEESTLEGSTTEGSTASKTEIKTRDPVRTYYSNKYQSSHWRQASKWNDSNNYRTSNWNQTNKWDRNKNGNGNRYGNGNANANGIGYGNDKSNGKGKSNRNGRNNGKSIEDIRKEVLPDIGNFALPTSQQPGAFVSIGQNVIDKNQKQAWLFADAYVGPKRRYVDAIPGVLYQPTDNLSFFLNVPYALDYREDDTQSSGIEDIYCQAEYAYYNNPTKQYNDQATILGYVSAPTGSATKDPPTGYGGVGYFLGTTFTRTYVDWIFFTSYGAFFSTKKDNIKYGNYYLYQFGIGKNICYIKSKLIVDWLLEFDGTYYEKNNVDHELDPDSGGNIGFLVPSLWLSTEHLIVQLGIGVPVYQEFYGDQNKFRYLWVANIGWTF